MSPFAWLPFTLGSGIPQKRSWGGGGKPAWWTPWSEGEQREDRPHSQSAPQVVPILWTSSR